MTNACESLAKKNIRGFKIVTLAPPPVATALGVLLLQVNLFIWRFFVIEHFIGISQQNIRLQNQKQGLKLDP